MSTLFTRTLKSLDRDGVGWAVAGAGAAAAVAFGCELWITLAPLTEIEAEKETNTLATL